VDLPHDLSSVLPKIFVAELHDLLKRIVPELLAFSLDLGFNGSPT